MKCSFSALKQVRTYCNSIQSQERLISLNFMSTEKSLLLKVKLEPLFYDQVTKNLLEQIHKADLFSNILSKSAIKLLGTGSCTCISF